MKRFIKRRFLPFLAVLVVLIGALVIPIGAADIDWSKYPTSNLFDFESYVLKNPTVINGTGSVNYNAGTVYLKSSAEDNYVQLTITIALTPNTQYSLSCNSTAVGQLFVFRDHNDYDASIRMESPSLSFNSGSTGKVWIRIDNDNVKGSNTFSNFMLNVGSTPYPYQPYVPGLLRGEYERGFNAALDEVTGTLSPLHSATNVKFSWTDIGDFGSGKVNSYSIDIPGSDLVNLTYYFMNGCFNVSLFLWDEMGYDGDRIYPTSFDVEITWPEYLNSSNIDVVLQGQHGGTVSSSLVQISTKGDLDVATFREEYVVNGGDGERRVASFSKNLQFNKLTLHVGSSTLLGSYGPYQYLDFCFGLFSSGTYAQGYSAGLKEGLAMDRQEALNDYYQAGQKVGYDKGYTVGKKDGLTISENGDWRNLILAVVEAPVNTFQSLFNFKILGLDMRAAFGALMTMCVVLIVVKKVVL